VDSVNGAFRVGCALLYCKHRANTKNPDALHPNRAMTTRLGVQGRRLCTMSCCTATAVLHPRIDTQAFRLGCAVYPVALLLLYCIHAKTTRRSGCLVRCYCCTNTEKQQKFHARTLLTHTQVGAQCVLRASSCCPAVSVEASDHNRAAKHSVGKIRLHTVQNLIGRHY